MNILITGGYGFIGSHLAEYHLNRGDHAYIIDNLSTGSLDNISTFINHPLFHFEETNILTWPDLNKTINWADRVYHLAAVVGVYRVLAEPIEVVATNIAGCERVLRAVAASQWQPRTIIASSSEVYGHSQQPRQNESDTLIMESSTNARWSYSISKLADEALGTAYYRKKNSPITIVRMFNTTGSRQTGRYGMVLPRFIQQALHNEPITVYGNGTQTRCFCDVRDMITILNLLAESKTSIGKIVNVGHKREISINDLAKLVKEHAKSFSEIQYIPYKVAYQEEFSDIQRRRPDLSLLHELIQFKPNYTLEQTIDSLINSQ